MTKTTVVAAMSGGVDSAVAAALLKRDGFEVIGITLQIWQEHAEQGKFGGCCSLGAVEDARRAARQIGIPHYVLNFRDYFAQTVVSKFVDEYGRGRTPNPCIECNRTVKFRELLRQALALGADYLATGHYARIRFNDRTDRYELLTAMDTTKDQSYALYTLSQEQLARTLMPLGRVRSKQVTRAIAEQLGLPLANKPDSQEICFVPQEGYTAYLQRAAPHLVRTGRVIDTAGRPVGEHSGVAFYTIGQRKRLPPSKHGPLYVLSLEPTANTVTVGAEADLYSAGCRVVDCSWTSIPQRAPNDCPLAVYSKIRYNAAAVPASVYGEADSHGVLVRFESPQRAVTPGQAAVFYSRSGDEAGQVVVGGGTIDRAVD